MVGLEYVINLFSVNLSMRRCRECQECQESITGIKILGVGKLGKV